jgi:hypothetical protein
MIKIKVLDKELTVKEAKQLYNELKEIFENSSQLKRFRYDDMLTEPLDCKGKEKIPEPDFNIFTPLRNDNFFKPFPVYGVRNK